MTPEEEAPNKLTWYKQQLRIPWVYVDRQAIQIVSEVFLFEPISIIGVNPNGKTWVQLRLISSIKEAKDFIKAEIQKELDSSYFTNNITYLTPQGVVRSLRYGLLAKNIREYIQEGFTHLGFSLGIDICNPPSFYSRNKLGLWKPVRPVNF